MFLEEEEPLVQIDEVQNVQPAASSSLNDGVERNKIRVLTLRGN